MWPLFEVYESMVFLADLRILMKQPFLASLPIYFFNFLKDFNIFDIVNIDIIYICVTLVWGMQHGI